MNIEHIYALFPDYKSCIICIQQVRWGSEVRCPYCNSGNITPMAKESRHHCNRCNTSFAATVHTLFHHSKIDLQKRFLALLFTLHGPKSLSVRKLAATIGVNPNTAWQMTSKIKKALLEESDLLR